MAELLPSLGKHRIFYRASAFKEGLVVKAIVTNPFLVELPEIILTPINKGYYYYDYFFDVEGTYLVGFYEDDEQKASQAYLVQLIVAAGAVYKGPNIMGY